MLWFVFLPNYLRELGSIFLRYWPNKELRSTCSNQSLLYDSGSRCHIVDMCSRNHLHGTDGAQNLLLSQT